MFQICRLLGVSALGYYEGLKKISQTQRVYQKAVLAA